MTDKVQKIRAFLVGIADTDGVSTILARAIEKKILPYIDSLREESVTSVWHDTKEKPKEGSKIAFWDGYRMMGMDYADCRHLNDWLSHSEKWAYVEDLLKL